MSEWLLRQSRPHQFSTLPPQNMPVDDTDTAFSTDELQPTLAQPDTSHTLRYALVTVGEEDGESSDSSDGRPHCAMQST